MARLGEAVIFVDTSALYAFIDGDDAGHEAVRGEIVGLLADSEALATSDFVIVETVALLHARLGVKAVRDFVAQLLPELDLLVVGADGLGRALSAVVATDRRKLSVVDCASFEVMRGHGIDRALTLDRHFAEAGFEVRPSPK
jgi:predicted nucleic acid-binding protein